MSGAIRNTLSRIHRGTPYNRLETTPQPVRTLKPKKLIWSLSGILSYLNPLRSRDDMEVDQVTPAPPAGGSSVPPAQSQQPVGTTTPPLNTNNEDTPGTSAPLPPPPAHPPTLPQTVPAAPLNVSYMLPSPAESPEATLESVFAYLHDRQNQTLLPADADTIIETIKQATASQGREPFRFTTSPSPFRGNSPAMVANSVTIPSASPSKMLSKNPNGTYRWEGGGSAKVRTRDRYRSPAFGPSRATPDRLILDKSTSTSITENTKADTKRRRVTNDTGTSFAEASGAPATPPTPTPTFRTGNAELPKLSFNSSATNGSPSKPNGLPASTSIPRARATFVSLKPNTPVILSPLCQAWGQTFSGSPDSPPQTQKKSSAANFMAGLIKDNTPTKKPDISNSYQTPGSARATRPKRPRATGKPTPPKKLSAVEDKEKVYSPQAIIEATVPKGIKRSRPPTSVMTTKSLPAPRSFRVTVKDVEDEDNQPVAKRMKLTINGRSAPSASKGAESTMPEIKVNGVNESNTLASSPFGSSISSAHIRRSSNAPKEPSKLRYSYQPDAVNSPPPAPVLTPAVLPSANLTPVTFPFPAPMPPPTFSFPNTPASSPFSLTMTCTSGDTDPKAATLALPESSLPVFSFVSPSSRPSSLEPSDAEVHGRAKAASTFKLPTFLFPSSPVAGPSKLGAVTPPVAAPIPTAPPKSFDWNAAGVKPPSKAATGEWICGICTLTNTDPAMEKCNICGEHRETSKPAPPAIFNWAAAGMKPPAAAADQWQCPACMLTQDGIDKWVGRVEHMEKRDIRWAMTVYRALFLSQENHLIRIEIQGTRVTSSLRTCLAAMGTGPSSSPIHGQTMEGV
ncbi:hypothetical protein EDD18DRAFT_1429841 [Armillaria luteobubalina]|uniref:RanBP2-type domain-containing protein n=1 Tax=Armillaria luteobubalina TaxID=153913 RepID=A0AA39TEN2_9AGAR|nr:hypothetical protein EDD18DRAFT_1429841 [Armillaria luteobubalina]